MLIPTGTLAAILSVFILQAPQTKPPEALTETNYGSIHPIPPSPDCHISVFRKRAAVDNFINKYMDAKQHRAFAQSTSGTWAWRSARTSTEYAVQNALAACQAVNKKYEDSAPCQIIHVDDYWTPACLSFMP